MSLPEEKTPLAPKSAPKKQGDAPPVCQGCWKFERFGRACWVFWEGKKICTQYEGQAGESYYRDVSENVFNVETLWT